MPSVNTDIYDKSVHRAAMVRLYENRSKIKIDTLLKEHEARVLGMVEAGRIDRRTARALNKNIAKELRSTFKDISATSSRSMLDLVFDQTSYTYQNIEASFSKIFHTKKPNRIVSEDIVLKKPLYSNKTLEAGWSGIEVGERKRIERLIRKGIAKGDSETVIARDLRKGNVFRITRNQARTLTTTAVTSVTAQADHSVYSANSEILKGWQYVSVLDSATTSICIERDQKIYPISDTTHLPPAHYGCRSTTTPVALSYDKLESSESLRRIRRRNLTGMSDKQKAYYDGASPMRESYDAWLRRQSGEIQLKHLGDRTRRRLFRSGGLTLDKFFLSDGTSVGIRELRILTDATPNVPGQTRRFATAKLELDTLDLGVTNVDELIKDKATVASLKRYYELQASTLDGNLSLTNYRGTLIGSKRQTKARVLSTPPTEKNMKYDPVSGSYHDARMYQPNPEVLQNNLRLVDESDILKDVDKAFIREFAKDMEGRMGSNELSAVVDNLRIVIGRNRKDGKPWKNLKGVINAQMKFDVMNTSDSLETKLRADKNLLGRLKEDGLVDPVLGKVQLQELHDDFLKNIRAKNKWEDKTAPKIARRLRGIIDTKIPLRIRSRLDDKQKAEFYLRFAQSLAKSDMPDRDQLAVSLGRDLYNMANYRGSRKKWHELGTKLLDDADNKGFFKLETYGVQKRRMKSRDGNRYFGPYYDTFAVNLRIVDKSIQEYSKLTRKVDLGLRTGATSSRNRLVIREGYKTYWVDNGLLGYEDTRIPIISAGSFSDFPEDLVDSSLSKALNWSAKTEYKIDDEFFDFMDSLINFEDDRGRAKYYHGLNEYRDYIIGRDDAYVRFKAMRWHRDNGSSFSNHPFLDFRARIYERGFIGPQSGETFRPFLNTAKTHNFSVDAFENMQDQVGSFLGSSSDFLEGRHNALTIVGRQKIAEEWRDELAKIGYHMRRGKPNDIRAVLESRLMAEVDGEEQGVLLRFALEMSRIDEHLRSKSAIKNPTNEQLYSRSNLQHLTTYRTNMALEQDASSSGAQIIALTTKNRKLAEMSNVVATDQKRRLYDEIATATFNDPEFKRINKRLGLTEKDLRKAAKAQNMVTFYGAGEKTGILNVEAKLAKILDKDGNTLVVKTSERDAVLNEISAKMARYKDRDPETYKELAALRKDVKDVFDKGITPGDDIMEQLYFLDPETREFVDKMTRNYGKVVTPGDFQAIARIMSNELASQVPILEDFTKFFGRLAEDFVTHAKPAKSSRSVSEFLKMQALKEQKTRPPELLKRFGFWKPDGNLSQLIYGVRKKEKPKKWTTIPWKNFDGHTVEQEFTQTFEERLTYKDADGKWVTNILNIPQKTDPTWWDEVMNKDGTINDIVDVNKARTAFAVNGNHSNDAVIVKRYHLWGRKNGVATSTIHDAFFNNVAELTEAKRGLREIYSEMATKNSVKDTLDEMRKRGLPRHLYYQYLNEAIDIGLIPVAGRSRVGGRLLTKDDILKAEDILEEIPKGFQNNRGWYGIGV